MGGPPDVIAPFVSKNPLSPTLVDLEREAVPRNHEDACETGALPWAHRTGRDSQLDRRKEEDGMGHYRSFP